MNKYQFQILTKAKKIVTDIFRSKVNPVFVFHNLDHTVQVVKAAKEIGEHYKLDDNDQFVLLVSAWFHDTGFSSGHAEGHEKESIKLANDFLYHRSTGQVLTLRIASCIQATRMPQQPLNMVENILCDADLYHLGTNVFSNRCNRLRRELQTYFERDIPKEEWCQSNLDFLKSHKYFTHYCRQRLERLKQEWIKQLQKNMRHWHKKSF